MKKIHFISSVLVLGVIFGLSGCTASSEVAPVSKAEVEKKVQNKVEEQPELVHMEKQGILKIMHVAVMDVIKKQNQVFKKKFRLYSTHTKME